MALNIVSANNPDGRIDVGRALDSVELAMFVYDLGPCPRPSHLRLPRQREDRRLVRQRRRRPRLHPRPVPWSHGEESWDKAR
jgi:hypothetical protein